MAEDNFNFKAIDKVFRESYSDILEKLILALKDPTEREIKTKEFDNKINSYISDDND